MTINEAVTYIEDIKNGLHETGKDFPYRDEVIPVAKEALDLAIKVLRREPCEDCISRQAVLSKIKEVCFSEEWTQFRVDNGSNGQRDFLITYIDILPSVTPTQRWIPVSERLPKRENSEQLRGWYLTTNAYGSVGVTKYEFESGSFGFIGWGSDIRIVAWMPLPQPYKESEGK